MNHNKLIAVGLILTVSVFLAAGCIGGGALSATELKSKAIEEGNVSYCDQINKEDKYTKQECYFEVAEETGNAEPCVKPLEKTPEITGKENKEQILGCLRETNLSNPKLCKQNIGENFKSSCLSLAAWHQKNPNTCKTDKCKEKLVKKVFEEKRDYHSPCKRITDILEGTTYKEIITNGPYIEKLGNNKYKYYCTSNSLTYEVEASSKVNLNKMTATEISGVTGSIG